MEGKNTQESLSKQKTFKIPIKDFEDYLNTEASKEHKEEILDIFKNHNKLNSREEFIEIRYNLQSACTKGDVELIKLLLSEKIENDSKDLVFTIDKAKKTASLFKVKGNNQKSKKFLFHQL
mgnify:CR=1 FL=1